MKKYRISLSVDGGDSSQWVYAYGSNSDEAIENAKNNISIYSAEEVEEDED